MEDVLVFLDASTIELDAASTELDAASTELDAGRDAALMPGLDAFMRPDAWAPLDAFRLPDAARSPDAFTGGSGLCPSFVPSMTPTLAWFPFCGLVDATGSVPPLSASGPITIAPPVVTFESSSTATTTLTNTVRAITAQIRVPDRPMARVPVIQVASGLRILVGPGPTGMGIEVVCEMRAGEAMISSPSPLDTWTFVLCGHDGENLVAAVGPSTVRNTTFAAPPSPSSGLTLRGNGLVRMADLRLWGGLPSDLEIDRIASLPLP
jgi:hypothetical protein